MGNKTSQIIAASTLPPSATVITLNNAVLEAGVYNRVLNSGDNPMIVLLPPAPTDGMLVGVVSVGLVGAPAMRYDGNGKNVATAVNGTASQANSADSSTALFRFDADQNLWTVLTGVLTGGIL